MSEKASLLTSIPPVSKSATVKKSSLLSPVDNAKVSNKASTLLMDKPSDPVRPTQKPVIADTATVGAVETVASEVEEITITPFQKVVYTSFVLTFCLAGFAAVVLFRKSAKLAEARFVTGARTLAMIAGVIALHGFFATYLFVNYLRDEATSAPLVFSMALWVVIGPAIGVILNYLLTPAEKPEKSAVIFDAVAYAAIFICAMLGISTGIKANAALIFSLLAGFLFIVPIARSFAAFRISKARHPELREASDQVLVYALLVIPGLFPILGFVHVCGLSPDLTQFLFNFLTFDFVLIAGLAMIASADLIGVVKTDEAASVAQTPIEASLPTAPVTEEVAGPTPAQSSARPVGPAPKVQPPRKPVATGGDTNLPSPPRRPGASSIAEGPSAPNPPSRIKAPAKPKKRF